MIDPRLLRDIQPRRVVYVLTVQSLEHFEQAHGHMVTYVIEHMEADESTPNALPPWVLLEYTHMTTLAGPASRVLFTHLSARSCAALQRALPSHGARARAHTRPVLALLADEAVPASRICLLDPKAPNPLEPADHTAFDWFLFGGILGDDPPRDRTAELRQLGFPSRHLGPVQMTTDTALGVTKRVIEDQVPLDDVPYVTFPTIQFNAKESVEMPFKYIAAPDGDPLLPPGMKDLLYDDLNKAFDV